MTINGGNVYLGCTLEGMLTENSGVLVLGPSAKVESNVQISQASSFTLGPGAAIQGDLVIQGLPSGLPQPGAACGTKVQGNVVVKNNLSGVEIGEPAG